MEADLELHVNPMRDVRSAIVYCFHTENDFMAVSLQSQEIICRNYGISKNWELRESFSDSGSVETSILERKGAKNLLKCISKNKLKNCVLLIHS